jgi:hypothetical protein
MFGVLPALSTTAKWVFSFRKRSLTAATRAVSALRLSCSLGWSEPHISASTPYGSARAKARHAEGEPLMAGPVALATSTSPEAEVWLSA